VFRKRSLVSEQNSQQVDFEASAAMSTVLIVGATRGLGASLTKFYAEQGSTVFATARSQDGPKGFPSSVKWLTGVDLMNPEVGNTITSQLIDKGLKSLDAVVSPSPSPSTIPQNSMSTLDRC
jgi:hypothetical protein